MATLSGLMTLGRDAELRTTNNGTAVAQLALAYNYGQKVDGKRPTQWIRASMWGNQATALHPYLLKGKQVQVTLNDVHMRSYESNGETKYSLEGKVIDFEFGRDGGGNQAAAPAPAPAPARAPVRQPAPQRESGGFDDMDDSIPF